MKSQFVLLVMDCNWILIQHILFNTPFARSLTLILQNRHFYIPVFPSNISCNYLDFFSFIHSLYIKRKKCRAHKKSHKILRDLRDIFFAWLFVSYLCVTFNMRDFFRFLFSATFSSLEHLKQRQFLSGKWMGYWKQTWKLSEFHLVAINKLHIFFSNQL